MEKLLPIYDESYFSAEDFLLTTQKQIEHLIPMVRSLRLDEISMLPFLVEAYKSKRDETEKFLSETLNKELK